MWRGVGGAFKLESTRDSAKLPFSTKPEPDAYLKQLASERVPLIQRAFVYVFNFLHAHPQNF